MNKSDGAIRHITAIKNTITQVTIDDLTRAELTKLWQQFYKSAPPKAISLIMLKRFIHFEMQAKQTNNLNTKDRRKLKQLQNPDVKQRTPCNTLAPGAQFIREWNGITHKVEVIDTSDRTAFVWQNKTYKSLSAIARAITGAHWSGPRFFGLNADAGKNS